jgi:hypothetical protein
VAEKGWIALSHNKEITRIKRQRDACMEGGLALFLLIGGIRHEELARNLIATMGRVLKFRERHKAPFIAKVHRPSGKIIIGSMPGVLEMYLTEDHWRRSLK